MWPSSGVSRHRYRSIRSFRIGAFGSSVSLVLEVGNRLNLLSTHIWLLAFGASDTWSLGMSPADTPSSCLIPLCCSWTESEIEVQESSSAGLPRPAR